MLPLAFSAPGGMLDARGGTDGAEPGSEPDDEAGVAAGDGGTALLAMAEPGGEFGTVDDPAADAGGPKPAGTPEVIPVAGGMDPEDAGKLFGDGMEDDESEVPDDGIDAASRDAASPDAASLDATKFELLLPDAVESHGFVVAGVVGAGSVAMVAGMPDA